MKKRTWALVAIASIPLVMTLGNSMLIPVIPAIQRELNISTFQGSLIITVYSTIAVPFIPIAGFLSDRIGRKTVIIPSLILAAIGGIAASAASFWFDNPYKIILAARILQGIGAAGAFPIVLPLIRDLFQKEDDVSHALGLIETSNTFGKVLSPILGAYLATITWYTPFLAIPVLSFLAIIAIVFCIKSPSKTDSPLTTKQFLEKIKPIFINEGRWLAVVYLTGCIIMLILFGILFYFSELLELKYDIYNLKKGFILAIPLAGLCLASYITGRLLGENKSSMKWAALTGMSVFAAASVFIIFVVDLNILILGLFIGCSGIGIALPSLDALIIESIDQEQNGTVTSFYNSMRFIGVASGPPIFALLIDQSHQLVFIVAALIASLSVFIIVKYIKTD